MYHGSLDRAYAFGDHGTSDLSMTPWRMLCALGLWEKRPLEADDVAALAPTHVVMAGCCTT